MSFNCCINCEKRFPACHDECEDYQNAKLEREKINERKRRENEVIGVSVELSKERQSNWIK